jgi:heparan-alpha-glucosaminide N-acetyltransferase
MTASNRIYSIDIMRGLTLILMLFVNDLHMPGVPAWLGHRAADFDGMGLADWVFPGFMFMVGMAIPFAIGNRIKRGESDLSLSKHILIRSLSLIIIGVLMSNSRNVNGEFTGISKSIWSFIMYSGVFLIWNDYKETDKNKVLVLSLKIAGIALIIPMVYIFRSGALPENGFSFRSWGILGTIGWGYLAASFIYLAFRDSIMKTSIALIFFLTLNILSKLHLLDLLNPVKPVLGVLINGNAPFIVLSGLFITLILKKISKDNPDKAALTILSIGILSILAGFFLRKWFIISKIQSTPSWALICNGISMALFAILFWIIDIKKHASWASFLKPAGENSLTVYLVPDMFYYIIWQLSLPLLFYKNSGTPLVVIAGSIVWALLMGALLPVLLARINFRLKL